jgi:hypothetical protein
LYDQVENIFDTQAFLNILGSVEYLSSEAQHNWAWKVDEESRTCSEEIVGLSIDDSVIHHCDQHRMPSKQPRLDFGVELRVKKQSPKVRKGECTVTPSCRDNSNNRVVLDAKAINRSRYKLFFRKWSTNKRQLIGYTSETEKIIRTGEIAFYSLSEFVFSIHVDVTEMWISSSLREIARNLSLWY